MWDLKARAFATFLYMLTTKEPIDKKKELYFYFWHNKFELMQEVVHGCKKC
jgi:hypothetical protein